MTASKPRLVVTRKLPAPVEERLSDAYDADLNESDNPYSQDELLERVSGADALLPTVTDRLDEAFIARLPETVRIIATFSVGYDHIDVAAATRRGIAVTNTPDVLTDATADITLLLMLGAARGAGAGEAAIRGDSWGSWAPTGNLGIDVTGKRLGILGMGRIGQAVAKRARAFDMEIHYHNRRRLAPDQERGARFHETLDGLLEVSDFFSINCASTAETRHLIDADRIARLPDGAVLVNSARGDIVDDEALIGALKSDKLFAAGLDVYENEPALHPAYRSLPNTFLLPHLGSATLETRIAMGMKAADNLDAFFAGKPLPDAVALS